MTDHIADIQEFMSSNGPNPYGPNYEDYKLLLAHIDRLERALEAAKESLMVASRLSPQLHPSDRALSKIKEIMDDKT